MGAEIEKFQKEIEKANVEKIKAVDWSEKKKQVQSRRSASTDSLLSMDEGSDSSSNLPPPALPPKGRFVSSDNLSPSPPALPPKKNNFQYQEEEHYAVPKNIQSKDAPEECKPKIRNLTKPQVPNKPITMRKPPLSTKPPTLNIQTNPGTNARNRTINSNTEKFHGKYQ